MISALQGLGKFVNFVRLTMRLHPPIFVVEPAVLVGDGRCTRVRMPWVAFGSRRLDKAVG